MSHVHCYFSKNIAISSFSKKHVFIRWDIIVPFIYLETNKHNDFSLTHT